ncbi:MAG: HEAT repeat domain-containing protein [Candidatus Bipolaricaulia bacterium]
MPALIDALQDQDGFVRQAAAEALEKIRGEGE